jgi:hypothetical protein
LVREHVAWALKQQHERAPSAAANLEPPEIEN